RINGSARAGGIALSDSTKLILSNSIIHYKNSNAGRPAGSLLGAFVAGTGGKNNYADVTGNIFICDVDSANYVVVAGTSMNNGMPASNDRWQNNVYILVRGKKITWNATNRSIPGSRPEEITFEQWKMQSGQDKKSLYFDLRE